MPRGSRRLDDLYSAMKAARSVFDSETITELLRQVSEQRARNLAARLEAYIGTNLPLTIDRKRTLQDYRTNPYVLMTCASLMDLRDPRDFAQFLVNNKLYAGLETSFGKQVESIVMGAYPIDAEPTESWQTPVEKQAEFDATVGLSNAEKSRIRSNSIWREIDRSSIYRGVRYLMSIKSGPNTINDTQVNEMKEAIRLHYKAWAEESHKNYGVERLDIVLGLTYGTARTTNTKDIQVINKLLDYGFREEDRAGLPGVLTDEETGLVRVYRVIGQGYWAFTANPETPATANFAFLEVLLALSMALRRVAESRDVEDRLNARLQMLGHAIATLRFPRNSLPIWVREDFTDEELFWLASAMTVFFDEGM